MCVPYVSEQVSIWQAASLVQKNLADSEEPPLPFIPGGSLFNTEMGRSILRSPRTAKIATWLVEHLPVSCNKILPKKISGNAKALVVSP